MNTERVRAALLAWYDANARELPWRGTRDPYAIWVSEVMLQQTRVETVVPYYARFLARFPTASALAASSEDEVLSAWSGLGYYRRAHHLHAAARTVVALHGGVFPGDAAALAALPGIGRSTAAAITTFAGGAPAAILDGNVKRVLARHRAVVGFPGAAEVERALWRLAEQLLPKRDAVAYTQGLMDLGATVCTRGTPSCGDCPVAADCEARLTARVALIPTPRPKQRLPHRTVRVLVIERAGEILFERRPAAGVWGGLWSLPETAPDDDVARHCLARFGAAVTIGAALPPIAHGFTHYRLTIEPQRVGVATWPSRAEAPGLAWLTPDAARDAALPAPIKRLLRDL